MSKPHLYLYEYPDRPPLDLGPIPDVQSKRRVKVYVCPKCGVTSKTPKRCRKCNVSMKRTLQPA